MCEIRFVYLFGSTRVSPIIQKNPSFSTNIYSVFLILGIIDDDFLRMEHALSAITVLGIVLGVTLSLIPDDFFG